MPGNRDSTCARRASIVKGRSPSDNASPIAHRDGITDVSAFNQKASVSATTGEAMDKAFVDHMEVSFFGVPSLAVPGLRDVVSWPGAVVPVSAARRLAWSPGRAVLLRLVNDRLRRFPRPFSEAVTDVGRFVDGHTSDLIERYLYVFGTWEPSLGAFFRGHLRAGDVFVDIGANVGYFSLLAARAVGPDGQVVSFEPLPSTVAKLRRNIGANGLGNVTVLPYVASDEPGEVEMFAGPPTNLGKSGTAPVTAGASAGLVTRVVAADAVPRELWPRIRAIKVDVEGDELRVVRGLAPLLASLSPGAAVVVEVAPDRLRDRGGASNELFELMVGFGFTAARLGNDYHPSHYARPHTAAPEPIDTPPTDITDVVFTKTG
jgi:FkbM family methyltransferase